MRRNNPALLTPAELAVRQAIIEVEKLPSCADSANALIKLSGVLRIISDLADLKAHSTQKEDISEFVRHPFG